jgi:tRNA(Ile)-lysidine synthase
MAQRLRQEETVLEEVAAGLDCSHVEQLRKAQPALRRRALEKLLKEAGLPEPNASHIAQAEALVLTEHPSAFSVFPGGVILRRNYGRLEPGQEQVILPERPIGPGGQVFLPEIGVTVTWKVNGNFSPEGEVAVRCRRAGDEITLKGGTKSLKKLFADRKIPAPDRLAIPVVADDRGVLAVMGIGPNLARSGGECFEFTTVLSEEK